MTTPSLSPAARIVVNPWDAQRVRLQEAVIEAAIQCEVAFGNLGQLAEAVESLLRYTAPKHHAAKTRKAAKS